MEPHNRFAALGCAVATAASALFWTLIALLFTAYWRLALGALLVLVLGPGVVLRFACELEKARRRAAARATNPTPRGPKKSLLRRLASCSIVRAPCRDLEAPRQAESETT